VLNGHDESLVNRELAIPGFRYLLQPAELRKLLCRRGALSDPGQMRAGYLRYKPGMNCIARFEFRVGSERRFAYAKAFGADGGIKLQKAREKDSGWSPLGPGTVVLEDQRILFSVFPHDAKLSSVARLGDQDHRSALLARLFKSRPGWEAASIDTLNYKPERRHVARFTNPGGDSATVKFYSDREFDRVREFRKHLQPTENVRFPEWIGGSKAHRALAFEWMPGTILRDLPDAERLAATRRAGATIAHFHRGRQPRFRPQDPALATAQVLALAEDLAVLLPRVGDHARELALALAEWRSGLDDPCAPVHGDFYDKQVVVGDGGLALIDSDRAHLGHPADDLGCFVAHLERNAVNGTRPAVPSGALTEALLEGYAGVNPGQDLSRLGQHAAHALFRLIHNPFRDRAPDWPAQTSALLRRVAALFER